MPAATPHRLLGLLVAGVLLAACGSDDASSDDTTTTEPSEETTTTAADTTSTTGGGSGVDVCSLFDPADLEAVTGLPFEEQEGDDTSCTYSSSTGAAIAVNIADVRDAPDLGIEGAQTTCEDGSVEEITVTQADAAFTCIVSGIPTVAAVGGDGFLVVLTGDDADEAVDDGTITDALVQILENAIAGSAG